MKKIDGIQSQVNACSDTKNHSVGSDPLCLVEGNKL